MFAGQPAGAVSRSRIVRTSSSPSIPLTNAATSAANQNHGFDFKRLIDDICQKDQPISAGAARPKHELLSPSDNADDGDDESDEEELDAAGGASASRRFQPNTRFLGNVLKSALLHNERVEHVQTNRGGISELDSGSHIEVNDPRGEFANEKRTVRKSADAQQLWRAIQRAQSDGMVLNESTATGLTNTNRRVTKGRGKFSGGMQEAAADGVFESVTASSSSSTVAAAHLHTPAQRAEYQKTHDRYRRARGVALLHQVANHYGISITIHPASSNGASANTTAENAQAGQENENQMQDDRTPPSDDADATASNEQKSDSVISKVKSISLSRTAADSVPSSVTKVIKLSRSDSNSSTLTSKPTTSTTIGLLATTSSTGQPTRRTSDNMSDDAKPDGTTRKIISLKSSAMSSPSSSPPINGSTSIPPQSSSSSTSSTIIQLQRKRKEFSAVTDAMPSAAAAATVPASASSSLRSDDPLSKRIKLNSSSSSNSTVPVRNRPAGILGAALKGIVRLP